MLQGGLEQPPGLNLQTLRGRCPMSWLSALLFDCVILGKSLHLSENQFPAGGA